MQIQFNTTNMKITKVIETEQEYEKSLKRLEKVFDAKPNSPEKREAELLVLLIEKFEDEHYPIEAPDPIEAIKFRMEQMGYKQKDLEGVIGYKGHVSEILNRKRKLTLDMIRNLHEKLNIPLASLVQVY